MTRALIILRPDDAGPLAILHARAFDTPWSAVSLRNTLKDAHALGLGLMENDSLIGFAIFRVVAGEADLLTIAAAPELQRTGIASYLMRAAQSRLGARGVSRITLDVAEDNAPARALYRAQGFQIDGRRPDYYTSGRKAPVDAVLMSKSLAL